MAGGVNKGERERRGREVDSHATRAECGRNDSEGEATGKPRHRANVERGPDAKRCCLVGCVEKFEHGEKIKLKKDESKTAAVATWPQR